MKRTSNQTNGPKDPREKLEVEDSYDEPDLMHRDRNVGDSRYRYRPFYWYNRDYNIPDECHFYL